MSELHRISPTDNPGRKADVVFIHGLGGDAFGTWRHNQGVDASWPHWIAEEFPDVAVWSLGYAASPTRWARWLPAFLGGTSDAGYAMSLPDRAQQVLDLLVHRGIGERPIMFVCHSLGGLLAKQVLRKSVDASDERERQVATSTRAVLFLATPHTGADLASLLNTFRAVFGATVSIEDLREHDAHLRDLYDWYRGHAPDLGIRTRTYYETRGVRGLHIVKPTSAHPGIGDNPVALDDDHLSIAKPRSRDAQVCDAARGLLRDAVLAAPSVTRHPALPTIAEPQASPQIVVTLDPGSLAGAGERRVPHELPPAAERFFGRPIELERLTERLRAWKNAAVVGPGGMGKTALASEAVRAVVGETDESLTASPYSDGVVFLDLYAVRGQAESAWNTLANKLGGPGFREQQPAFDRATHACQGRRALIIVEGGEEADGYDGRVSLADFKSVLSPENRLLLLTRLSTQAAAAETIELKEALEPEDAAALFDSLSEGRVPAAVRERVLELLEGHPLALTWAGNLLARGDEDPERLVSDWQAKELPSLSDPANAEHTLEWLFGRSIRGLDQRTQSILEAAGLLARAPFPLDAISNAFGVGESEARGALVRLTQSGLVRRSTAADSWEFTHVLGYRFARKESGSDPVVRGRLGGWIHERLTESLAGADTLSLQQTLEHAAALLRTDNDQLLWIPLAGTLLYDASDRMEDLGRLDLVRTGLNAVSDWMSRLSAPLSEQQKWLHERYTLFARQGDVRRGQGDLVGALAAYRQMLRLAQQLTEADPSNVDLQRNLTVSQNRLGDVLRDQGDLAGALAAYNQSLTLIQRLVGADPTNAGWQHDLSVSYERRGGALQAQGDLLGALEAFRQSLVLRKQLAEGDPSNTGLLRDLSVIHNKLGDALRQKGDPTGALAAFRQGLPLAQQLAESDPSNAGWQRDLSVSHNKLGNVLRDQGDLAGALTAYLKSMALVQRLADADPSNAGWQRDLSYTLTLLAQIAEVQDKRPEALDLAERSLRIDERLAALDPTNVIWQGDVRVSRALVARLRGGLDEGSQ